MERETEGEERDKGYMIRSIQPAESPGSSWQAVHRVGIRDRPIKRNGRLIRADLKFS